MWYALMNTRAETSFDSAQSDIPQNFKLSTHCPHSQLLTPNSGLTRDTRLQTYNSPYSSLPTPHSKLFIIRIFIKPLLPSREQTFNESARTALGVAFHFPGFLPYRVFAPLTL